MAEASRHRGRRSSPPSLFAPGALVPSGPRARPAAPAAIAAARAARAEESGKTMERLRAMAADLARRFGLRFATLEAERDGVLGHYGICYHDGLIRIRLRHATTGRLLKDSSLVDTVCHELAHLRHFDHSPSFKDLYLRILEEARQRGYYRPGPEWRRGQRSLFPEEACATGLPDDPRGGPRWRAR